MSDNVNHPSHYTRFGKSEVIDITEELNFNRGNAVKYVARAGHKAGTDELEDLSKARFYINREIERVKAKREKEEAAKKTLGVELFDIIEQLNFNRGSVVKYVTRAGTDELEDLEKARFYINREIDRVKAKREKEEAAKKTLGVELFDIIEQLNFNRGSVVKYVTRAGTDELEDLEKAQLYINREIDRVKAKREKEEADEKASKIERDDLQHEVTIQHVRDELQIKAYAHVASKNSFGFHIVQGETVVKGRSFFVARCGKIDFDSVRLPDSRDGRCFICGTMRPGRD